MNAHTAVAYTAEERDQIVDHVCEQIALKRPLYKVLREDDGLCSIATFIRWQSEDEDLQAKVARAREHAAQAYIDEIVDIADTPEEGEITTVDEEGNITVKREDMLGHRKLRVYAREKAAQMIAPRKFGQKLDVTSGGEKLPAPVNQTTLIDARIQSLIGIAMQRRDDPREAEKRSLLDD